MLIVEEGYIEKELPTSLEIGLKTSIRQTVLQLIFYGKYKMKLYYIMPSLASLKRSPMSDDEIRQVLGPDVKILKYYELADYETIQDLLPKPVDAVVILYELKPSSGHWCALGRLIDTYLFMDPYGYKFDTELEWVNMKRRRLLNELIPYLTNLLNSVNHDYNKVRYQHMDSNTNSCGDHVCFFIYNLLNNHMDLDKYHKYMNILKDKLNISYDDIVVQFTNEYTK
jgi:hypothetical protein